MHKSSGRIYRLRGKNAKAQAKPFNYAERSSEELIGALDDDNKWRRQTALRLLGDRRDAKVVAGLKQDLFREDGQKALET